MPDERFVPGLELSERFYREAVEPLVRSHFGEVPHSAARIGAGSEVLGFDTARSADHEWGPRLQLFLDPDDTRAQDVRDALSWHLPKVFLGYPTHFAGTGDVRTMAPTAAALRAAVTDPEVAALPLVGAVDQYVDSTDVLEHAAWFRAVGP